MAVTATADIIGHHIVSMLRIVAELAGWLDDSGKVARRVRRTIVALLRPAESATRRLIIAASAGIRVEVRELPPRPERPRGPSWMALLATARRRGAEANPNLRHPRACPEDLPQDGSLREVAPSTNTVPTPNLRHPRACPEDPHQEGALNGMAPSTSTVATPNLRHPRACPEDPHQEGAPQEVAPSTQIEASCREIPGTSPGMTAWEKQDLPQERAPSPLAPSTSTA